MFLSDPGFIIGADYGRALDIHDRFGGSRQSGISPSARAPFVFLFTGDSGQQFGYEDGWQGDGIFAYTGEGQNGDMQFVRGNKAIRDHAEDGKDLLLFEQLVKGRGVRFLGPFACASWERGRGPDVSGNDRRTIRFHLVRITIGPVIEPKTEPTMGIEQLRTARC